MTMPVPPKEFLHLLSEVIPFNKFLGIIVEEAREGFVRLQLPYRAELIGDASRPALHGGAISTLIDVAGGFAVWTQLAGLEDRVSTIDLRVDYLAPGAPEALLAEAHRRARRQSRRCRRRALLAAVAAHAHGCHRQGRVQHQA